VLHQRKNRNGTTNRIIDFEIHLSTAIRYFAGGAVPDIAIVHGILPLEVRHSIWMVVDAIN